MLVRLISLFALVLIPAAHAGTTKGMVEIAPKKRLYVEYTPATRGKPTIVILNGLTYKVSSWDRFADKFPGYGVLRYDMTGMGATLLDGPLPVDYLIPWTDQVEDLAKLLRKLNIRKAHFLGLSYGGGIAVGFADRFPRMVESLILMAPFTEPLAGQDSLIRYQMAQARAMNPYLKETDDELYDFFLRNLVYSTYPAAEPVVLENPYKLEAVFRIVQGIRKFRAVEHLRNLPDRSVHLMIALQDQYIPRTVFDDFWKALSERHKASRLLIFGSEHKIPEAIPAYAAAWVKEILHNNRLVQEGRTFDGNVFTRTARTGDQVIDLSGK